MQLYLFPTVQVDPLFHEVVKELRSNRFLPLNPGAEQAVFDHRTRRVADPSPDLEDHRQYALRLLYYTPRSTVGLTLFRGRDSLFYNQFRRLNRQEGEDEQGNPVVAYDVSRHADLAVNDALGLEMATIRGKWIWKLEYTYGQTFSDLDGSSQRTGGTADRPLSAIRQQYYDAIIADNRSRLYLPINRHMLAIGANRELGEWRLDLGVVMLRERLRKGDDLKRLEDSVFDDSGLLEEILPSVHITRFLGSYQQSQLGMGMGFFGSALGATAYFRQRRGDNFQWQAGLQITRSLGDRLISRIDDDNDRYDLETELVPAFHLGVIQHF